MQKKFQKVWIRNYWIMWIWKSLLNFVQFSCFSIFQWDLTSYLSLCYIRPWFFHKYKTLVSKYGCTCHNLIKNGISHPTFYGNVVVNKAHKFKLDPGGLKSHINKLIRRGYRHNIVVRSLNMVFIGTNIDL